MFLVLSTVYCFRTVKRDVNNLPYATNLLFEQLAAAWRVVYKRWKNIWMIVAITRWNYKVLHFHILYTNRYRCNTMALLKLVHKVFSGQSVHLVSEKCQAANASRKQNNLLLSESWKLAAGARKQTAWSNYFPTLIPPSVGIWKPRK